MKNSVQVHAASRLVGAVALAGFALAGCAEPELAIRVKPTGVWVYVDGEFTSPGREPEAARALDEPKYDRLPEYIEPFDHEMPLRYYGTTRLSARMPATQGTRSIDWLEQAEDVTIDEPFSPWLFPLDFVLECLTYPFVDADARYAHRVTIELQRRPRVIQGIEPRDLPTISTRAKRAREER
jgi:hypothetical protein